MADGERQGEIVAPYRAERPLSDLIPPDRRRLHSVLLVSASLFTGAMLLLLGEQIYSAVAVGRGIARPSVVVRAPVRAAIFSSTVAAKYAWADRVSAVDGAPAPDGKVDPRVDVYLEGRFVALMVVTVRPTTHRRGRLWDTIVEDDPVPSGVSGVERGSASWQLGVFDGEGDRSLQRPDGSLVPLGEGRRLVHLYASDDGTIEDGTVLRVVGQLADGSLVEGPLFALRDVARDGSPPSDGTATKPPFDRGAAAGALGAIDVRTCYAPDGPTGAGHVRVTFEPSGIVSSAAVDVPPFANTPTGNCVAAKFSKARVPAFAGSAVRVGKSFVLGER